MEALTWVVVLGWSWVGLVFLVQGLRFLGAANGADPVGGGDWVSPGHALLMGVCRTCAGTGLVGLAVAVALGAPVVWAAAGAPLVLVVFGVVAFGGTRAIARRHGAT